MIRNSVFVRAGGGPAFVRTLERHHAQLSETDNVNAMDLLAAMSYVNEDVLSSIVKADACGVVVKCIRTCQLNDVCQRLIYRRMICHMFEKWLLIMRGSTLIRKELIKAGAIKIIILWLQECFTGGMNISAKTFLNGHYKMEALTFLYLFSEHNFACKTMLIEIGGLHAIAAVIRENWGDAGIQLACKDLLENMYCRCQQCTESTFCNLCGSKAKLACPCIKVRYCSKECQRKYWKAHKTLCRDTRQITETVNSTTDEYQLLKETATIDPNDDSLRGIDVVNRLRSASSVKDVMRWLLVLARVPYEEMLQSNDFAAVVHVMEKYVDVAEIQSRGCTVFFLFNKQEGVSFQESVIAVHNAGGSFAVLKAMKKHPYDTKVQGCACNVLVGLGKLRNPEGRIGFHVVHAILGAMMRHKDDFSVQEGGCGALRNLAMAHPDDKKGLVMTGAARVVAVASEKF
jgi:hypothetical protein